jgi:hypothetical protein
MDGASFLNKFRERLQQKRDARQEMQGMQDNQSMGRIDSTLNPMSNGTGSARPNFGQFAQKAIGSVMGGNKMGDALGFRQGVNEKLDKIQEAVGSDQGDPNANAAGMPPADPMNPNNATSDPSLSPMLSNLGASASAKKIAKKQAKQYAAEKGLSDKEAKSLKKEAKKSQSFDRNKNEHADNLAGGANNKTVNFGGSMKDIDPPKGNTMHASSTGVAKPEGWGHEQLKTDAVTDHVLGMRDMGFYSDKYAMDRIAGKMGYPASTYETVRHPGADSTALEKTIAKGPKKPELKLKATRTVKKLEPKKKLMAAKTVDKKLMAAKTVAKIKKKPLQKMTPRPAKKL